MVLRSIDSIGYNTFYRDLKGYNLHSLKNVKILYIEDDAFIRESAVEYLSYYSDFIYEAIDGVNGYEKYLELAPDIIISDIKMPKLNGLELIQKIRKKNQKTQIIIITAHADTEFLLQAVELKLIKYLIKPVSESKLLPILKESLEYLDSETNNVLILSDGYKYDLLNKSLFEGEIYIKLNKKESLFFDLCAQNTNRAVTYSEFNIYVWENDMSEYALSSLVKSLRLKLPPKVLENISGIGYKLKISC